jgi:hypothetical protein
MSSRPIAIDTICCVVRSIHITTTTSSDQSCKTHLNSSFSSIVLRPNERHGPEASMKPGRERDVAGERVVAATGAGIGAEICQELLDAGQG